MAPWITLATILGIIALILSMLTFTPSQAMAQDENDLGTVETADTSVEEFDVEQPEAPAAGTGNTGGEDNSTQDLVNGLNSLTDALTEGEGASRTGEGTPAAPKTVEANTGYNSDIEVEIEEIEAADEAKKVKVGEKVTISGTWDASTSDASEGASFWVTLPQALQLDESSLEPGFEALDGDVNGFSYDTTDQPTGEWEVEAELAEEINTKTVNFRTSGDGDADVAVDVPEALTPAKSAGKNAKISTFATDDSPIEVTVDRITHNPTQAPETQLHVGESARVEGTWKATQPLNGGETFTVGFPDELKIPAGFTFDVTSDGTGEIEEGLKIGECVVNDDNTFTCTLNDEVQNKEDVSGTWWIAAEATTYTTKESLQFDIPGGEVVVDLPGENGGISDGAGPMDTEKKGKVLEDRTSIKWTVDIAGPLLVHEDADEDGVVVLDDELSKHLNFCRPGQAKLFGGRPNNQNEIGALTYDDNGNLTVALNDGEEFRSDFLYTLEYVTCLADADLLITKSGIANGDFANTIVIGGKDYTGIIGDYTDWEPIVLRKEGFLRGGEDRFQKATWNIFEHGSALEDAENITLKDAFGASQEVCEDGLNITVWEQTQRPVWNEDENRFEQGWTNITSNFTGVSDFAKAGDKGFETTIGWTTFEFDPTKNYRFQYTNCLTTKGIPGPETEFGNNAVFNGAKLEATTKPPGFTQNKSGRLNTEPKEVGGQTQPAGTTIDWTVRVDGHLIEKLETLDITDEFSDTQAVCEAGNADLKDRLNFKLEARDFVNNGGKETVDLTGKTDVALDGDTLTFSMDAAEFGEEHFSRDYSYYITYTMCVSSGGLDDKGTKYGNAVDVNGVVLSREVTQNWDGGADGNGVSRGSFSLLKARAGGSADFGEDAEFTVLVEEFAPVRDGDGKLVRADLTDASVTPVQRYEIKVKADGTPVSGHYARGNNWQIRLTEVGFPEDSGFIFEPGRFVDSKKDGVTVSEDGSEAIIAIKPRENIEVELRNRATLGSATISKEVVGKAADAVGNQSFEVLARITNPDGTKTQQTLVLENGEEATIPNLKVGTIVKFSEARPADNDQVTWGDAEFVPGDEITITQDTPNVKVQLKNKANDTYGTFKIKNKLEGPEQYNSNVPDTFLVRATWTDANGQSQSKDLQVPKNGEIDFGEDLKNGTIVTLEEILPENGNGLAWGVPAWSGDVTVGENNVGEVTVGKDVKNVELKNYVDKNDGTMRVIKAVEGEAGEAVPEELEFTVKATWKSGTEYKSETLTINQNEATALSEKLPVGTEITFTELELPEVEGVEWGNITWATDPTGESWLKANPDGSYTGIISDDRTEGRLVTVSNEALWAPGAISYEKFIITDESGAGIPAAEANLPEGAEFEVSIENIELPAGKELPADAGIAVGDIITLNAANGFKWESDKVLPKGTTVTFSELTPKPLPGIDWSTQIDYIVNGESADAPAADIEANEVTEVEIHNRVIPTTTVDVDKIVTGPKGNAVTKDENALFQVTASWTDVDGNDRHCILNVVPGQQAEVHPEPANCDASIIDGKPSFPLNTEITFEETGATTDVANVKWAEVIWTVVGGSANSSELEGSETGVVVELTGEANDPVKLSLENKTSANGLIIIPIPIFPGGHTPTPPTPDTPTPGEPSKPGEPSEPTDPSDPSSPSEPGDSPKSPGSGPSQPSDGPSGSKGGGLANTGASVLGVAGAGLLLLIGGAWLALRGRGNKEA
ncbi:DUF5979 domain-containing protein [Corynebacterium stationis]|uniref:DUF5979 domain-containing protein n=1 Tax=Corynebacterium stationis TaxID=1705 RepID=UPI00076F934E|nr:DUF5979 domain-containing protein [Corynebacterium stationis]AMJ44210.1 hypothetical protein AW169_04280 [Corynebacterium stationis]AQX70670.1 hypothetical protein CA21670_03450 [Corynebacterium stationis]ASJ18359.1 hypothetical protein BA700_04280 [Corynebacterium stationis]